MSTVTDKVIPFHKLYNVEASPAGGVGLTLAEQHYVSCFANAKMVEAFEQLGQAMPRSLKVEFTFENGHKGGLHFRRL